MTFWELLESPQVKMELATPHTPSYWIQMGYRYGHNEGAAVERKRLGLDDIDTLNHCAHLLRAGEWSKEAEYLEAIAKAIEDKDGSD